MRRFLPVVSAIFIVVACFVPVQGQEYSVIDTMSFAGSDGDPGDTLVVPVDLVNTFDVAGFGFRIVYDSDSFEAIDVATGSRAVNFDLFGANLTEPGVIGFFATSMHPRTNAIPAGSGEIATISLVIRDLAMPGYYDFSFIDADYDSYDNSLTDTSSTLVVPVLTGGIIQVNSQTGIEEGEPLPSGFVLNQNYPNPFNGKTVISFDAARAGHVILDVYDLCGRKVSSLFSGYVEPGEMRIVWDGQSTKGDDLASGVFFYNMRTSWGESVTKRMTLLK